MSKSPGLRNTRQQGRRTPCTTYRLQFNAGFTFKDATKLLPYLKELGITDCYASPLFKATPESKHGYDVCDFQVLNPNLGTEDDFNEFTSRLRELGMGLVLDLVPNHMGMNLSNRWLFDVLENGQQSPFASYFDIDWQPLKSDLHDKIILPILGDHYASVLEKGELQLVWDDDTLKIAYFDKMFPVSPASSTPILENVMNELGAGSQAISSQIKAIISDAEDSNSNKLRLSSWKLALRQLHNESHSLQQAIQTVLGRINGNVDSPQTFNVLHDLLQKQHYRLAYWKVGPQEINYRRFFDVNELISVRMESADVFAAAHELVIRWLAEGKVTGLRVDHPDGLWNPEQYLARLQNTFRKNRYKTDSASLPLYVVAEKILTKDELLPEGWPVDGTTGYDFLNRVNGIFIDSTNADAFADIYQTFTHCAGEFSELVHSCKKRILDEFMASELTALTHRLKSAALSSRYGQDFTFKLLHEALGEIIAAYPVYRSYATETSIKPTAIEARHTEEAISAAKQRNSKTDQAAFDFIRSLLLLQLPADLDEAGRRHCREFVLKFQQLTGPVMAKGLEDTVFYIYNRFVSLNEVGGSPEEFGTSLAQFHQHNLRMAGRWPHSMLATSTHDTKRGEDVRARLNVISEMPIEWRAAVERWTSSNSKYKTEVAGAPAPYKNDEYLLYQTLLGAWPFDADRSGMFDDFKKRLLAYMFKAIREAKTNTTWNDPNQAYEEAVKTFIVEILDLNTPFMTDFREFQSKVAYFGIFNSLSQTVLKLTAPGVPDTYQGAELWDFSMVDPDNRRPVGFSLRQEMLINLRNASGKGGSTHGSQFEKLLGETHTGAVKMFTVHRALEFRRQHRVHFEKGDYVALSAAGKMKNHVCAFARCHGSKTTITIVPRLVVSLTNGRQMAPTGKEVWADTWLALPFSKAGDKFCNAFTHETHTVQSQNNEPGIFLSDALAYFPVALLEKVD